MSNAQWPLVSVVTPVHNGEKYLRESIESVLTQTYSHLEYIILNNASTDRTLEIAEHYRKRDKRIRISSNNRLLPCEANHNKAFTLIAPDSRYCKVLSADDWLFPECLARMVELGEANPSAGIIGSYQLSGGGGRWYVRNYGLPYAKALIAGREVCRLHLLGELSVFGNPTSNLYRADLVRGSDTFFPNDATEADVSACVKYLQWSDFGFVHQVLSYERLHNDSLTAVALRTNAYLSAAISDCTTYGNSFLTAAELEARIKDLLSEYYRYLSVNALKCREKMFWEHHAKRLQELGFPLSRLRLTTGILVQLIDLVLNPKATVQLAVRRKRMSSAARGRCP